MPHRIGKREAIDRALWRLIRDDLAGARKDLFATGRREERIHHVRQRMKRVRSLMRVVAPALGDRAAEAKQMLRGASRQLAGARDADAAVASARSLRQAAGRKDAAGFDRVVAELDRKAADAHGNGTPVGDVARRLAALENGFSASPDIRGARLFDKALARSYRQGRSAMRRAESSLATPDLHQWRKVVKDLWHLLRLARKRLPQKARADAGRLQTLGELLGNDHDHAMLAERLALSPDGDPALMRQLSLIAKERRSLEAEAFELGAQIYRQKLKKYGRRMRLNGARRQRSDVRDQM